MDMDIQTVLQTILDEIRTLTATVSKTTIESEITDPGHDEAWKANLLRTYDTYQHEGLEAVRRSRGFADQVMQNAIETANLVSKQAVRHTDMAIDRQWNVDEQGYTAEKILAAMQDPSVISAMVDAVAANMNS